KWQGERQGRCGPGGDLLGRARPRSAGHDRRDPRGPRRRLARPGGAERARADPRRLPLGGDRARGEDADEREVAARCEEAGRRRRGEDHIAPGPAGGGDEGGEQMSIKLAYTTLACPDWSLGQVI